MIFNDYNLNPKFPRVSKAIHEEAAVRMIMLSWGDPQRVPSTANMSWCRNTREHTEYARLRVLGMYVEKNELGLDFLPSSG